MIFDEDGVIDAEENASTVHHDLGEGEKYSFDAEVGSVLNLVINSLYENRDIFLRELISNASDACDKLRYESSLNPSLLEGNETLAIDIRIDKEAGLLFVRDNGLGMNKEDMINNLGTVAGSGTRRFVERIKETGGDASKMIGMFGVGFYSAFMVAEIVEVKSKKAGDNSVWVWRSSGSGSYEILESTDSSFSRGTEVKLKMKEDDCIYLDRFRIERIVSAYSDHISFPVNFLNDKEEKEQLNSGSALWTHPKSEISEEQYIEFFKSVAHVGGEPWMIMHNHNEGSLQYINLLFIPSIRPFDLFNPDRRCAVRLHVRRVFVADENIDLIPKNMRFLRGVVDSDDLPLNVSRESLQKNDILSRMRHSIASKVLNELRKRAEKDPEDYNKFWTNFGAVLKEGLCEPLDTESREKLLNVCKFDILSRDGKIESVRIDEYVDRMLPSQKAIYYVTADNKESAARLPQLEGLTAKGVDTILLTDPVDDFWISVVGNYKDISFKSAVSADVDLSGIPNKDKFDDEDSHEDSSDNEKSYDEFVKFVKEVLGDKIGEAKVSSVLRSSPVCLSVPEGALNPRMERLLMEQRQFDPKSRSAGIFELNMKHKLILSLEKRFKTEGHTEDLSRCISLLFDQAVALEGEMIKDPKLFADNMNEILYLLMS